MIESVTASEDAEFSAAPVRAGELVADKYLVERTLGVGGMGVVVAVWDQALDRRVAIKFLLPRLAGSETAVQRFVREARAATRISSEHVVRLLEIDKLPNGTPFFVMEYLEGRDLRALLREQGALPPSLAVDYMLQALQALAEGHLKNIVHRDVKPGNLFLTRRADGSPLIKVLDFGIAKTLESEPSGQNALTGSDEIRLGSPMYMPPEQLQSARDVDSRSDIWSIGVTLYELVSARAPFEGANYVELVSRILSSPPARLSSSEAPVDLPPGLEDVIFKCLAKDRGRRYANAAELAVVLAPFGSDDSRVSLARVRGMWSSTSSIPPAYSRLSTPPRQPPGSSTTTFPVASESGGSGRERGSAPGSHDQRGGWASSWRSWAVVGVAASAVAGALTLRTPPKAAPEVTISAQRPAAAAERAVSPRTAGLRAHSGAGAPPVTSVPPITSVPVVPPRSAPSTATSKPKAPRARAPGKLNAPRLQPSTAAPNEPAEAPPKPDPLRELIQRRRGP